MQKLYSRGLLSLAALVIFWALGTGTAALAQEKAAAAQEATLSSLLRDKAIVEAALYETTDGGRIFVLDRTREPPLLQFRGASEVIVLTRVPASRGDEILRTDAGDNLVRVTTLGAVTLYPRERPTGLPATRIGPAEPLPALAAAPADLGEALRALGAQAGKARIETPAEPASRGSDALLADAARVAATGLQGAAKAPGGAARVGQLGRIQFVYGGQPDARIEDGGLVVELAPGAGYAGRPSSMKIADAVLGGR